MTTHDGRTKVTARGETVDLWNTAAAGPPSAERIRASVDEAHAALDAYAAGRATEVVS